MGVLALASPLVILVVRVAVALARLAWGITKLLALLAAATAICVAAIGFAVWWCLDRKAARAQRELANDGGGRLLPEETQSGV